MMRVIAFFGTISELNKVTKHKSKAIDLKT